MPRERQRLFPILTALVALYFFWGTTYLTIRIAIDAIPPLLMSGTRYLLAGLLLGAYLRWRGEPLPRGREWLGAAITGILLVGGGNGGVTVAEQWVATGLASLVISTVPIWAVIFAALWGQRSGGREWLGVLLGLAGVAFLNLEGDFRATPLGLAILLGAAASWSFGSILSGRLPMPSGMMSSAAQMMAGGTFSVALGLLLGERQSTVPPLRSLAAFFYLVVFGSIVGYSCYIYLLQRVRPAVATSYAYVNPVIAVLLGVVIAGERLSGAGIAGMAVILSGVVLVASGRRRS